jgi:hypothetical protein
MGSEAPARDMSESPPQWVEPREEGEARSPSISSRPQRKSRLWFFPWPPFESARRKALYFARQVARRGEASPAWISRGTGIRRRLLGLSLTGNLADLIEGLSSSRKRGPFRSVCLIGSSMEGSPPSGSRRGRRESPQHRDRPRSRWPAASFLPRKNEGPGMAKARKIRIESPYGAFDLGYQFVEEETRYPTVSLMRRLELRASSFTAPTTRSCPANSRGNSPIGWSMSSSSRSRARSPPDGPQGTALRGDVEFRRAHAGVVSRQTAWSA